MSQSRGWLIIPFFLVVFLATVGWVLFSEASFWSPPGSMGDDIYFENLAFELAKNEGIRFDFGDEQWQQPYRESNDRHQFDWVLLLRHKGATTSRSPGFPFFVSLIYRVTGRQFAIVRMANIVILAISIATLLLVVSRLHGPITGLLALATISLDCFVLRTAGQFMTEALGTSIICCLFAGCLAMSISHGRSRWQRSVGWLAMGLLFAAGTLVRANLNAWFLIIAGALSITVFIRALSGFRWRDLAVFGTLFCAGVVVICAPWWIRNCLLTGHFSPFGTSGSFGLVGGFCDEAYRDFGNWNLEATLAAQRQAMQVPGFSQMTLAQQEFQMGEESSRQAWNWIAGNRADLPALAGMKVISHLGFYRQPVPIQLLNGLLFLGAFIGCWATWRSTGFWIVAILMLSVVTTSLTWSHYGRYSLPIRPLIHVASAMGTVYFWSAILRNYGFAAVWRDGSAITIRQSGFRRK